MLGFWEKWLNDIADTQRADGNISIGTPLGSLGDQDMYPVWPTWQSTYPLLVWYLYQHYGDRLVLETHYLGVKRYVDFLKATSKGQLFTDEPFGDHAEPQDDGFSNPASLRTPAALTANAYYFYNVVLLSRMAAALGRSEDARTYENLSRHIREAFNRRFLDPRTDQYATGSQASNALALYLGLVPPKKTAAVTKNLLDDIITKHDYHVSTGIVGSNAVVQVLPQHGAAEVLYRLATQTTFPSLGQQVLSGATTVCELYECAPWSSQNMKMFGSLDKFFYRNLAGIQPVSPGYRRVLIEPQAVGDLSHVSASQKTVRGEVKVEWQRKDGRFQLNVSIPVGMDAVIAVPKLGRAQPQISEGAAAVWASGQFVRGTQGLVSAKADGHSVRFQVGSGNYQFVLQ